MKAAADTKVLRLLPETFKLCFLPRAVSRTLRVQTAALLRWKCVPTGEVGTTPKLIVPSVEISSSALGIDGHRRGTLK